MKKILSIMFALIVVMGCSANKSNSEQVTPTITTLDTTVEDEVVDKYKNKFSIDGLLEYESSKKSYTSSNDFEGYTFTYIYNIKNSNLKVEVFINDNNKFNDTRGSIKVYGSDLLSCVTLAFIIGQDNNVFNLDVDSSTEATTKILGDSNNYDSGSLELDGYNVFWSKDEVLISGIFK